MAVQTTTGARGPADRLILLVLLATAGVRAAVLNGRSLWFDEAFSVSVSRLPVAQVWDVIARTDAHPPLHYLLLHAWIRLGDSPAMVRLLSLLFGVLGVAVAWWLARALGGPLLAATAGALLAAATLSVQMSVEARMFSLLALLSTAATAALWHAAAAPDRRWRWALYSLLMALAWYVDYLGFLLVPAHAAFVLIDRRLPSVRVGLVMALAGAALLYLPWWPALAAQLGEGRATTIWKGAMPPTAPLTIVALSSFGGYLWGLGGYLLDDGRWSWRQPLLILPFLVLVGVGAGRIPKKGGGRLLALAWAVPVLTLVALSLATGLWYAIPRYLSFVQPFFIVLLAQGVIAVTARVGRRVLFAGMIAAIIALNLLVLRASLADARYQPYDWAGAARHVQQRWQAGDGLLFYPHTARVAFGYYFPAGAGAVTLYAPSWAAGLTREQLMAALPPILTLVKGAPRLWLVLTDPTPPGSTEALLATVSQSYQRVAAADFRHVYVVLYERR